MNIVPLAGRVSGVGYLTPGSSVTIPFTTSTGQSNPLYGILHSSHEPEHDATEVSDIIRLWHGQPNRSQRQDHGTRWDVIRPLYAVAQFQPFTPDWSPNQQSFILSGYFTTRTGSFAPGSTHTMTILMISLRRASDTSSYQPIRSSSSRNGI